jgi:hypothetical protein
VADDAVHTLAEVKRKLANALDSLVSEGLTAEWGAESTRLYREQYARKENPYGEPWEYRKGDEKLRESTWKFGKMTDLARDSFSLMVARPNGRRSCVPYEPRGLGRWRQPFKEIAEKRLRLIFRGI